MTTIDTVRSVLGMALGLGDRANLLNEDSRLLGDIPELDSMAVIEVVTQLENTFGIKIYDDEISAETFATLESLTSFVETKRSS